MKKSFFFSVFVACCTLASAQKGSIQLPVEASVVGMINLDRLTTKVSVEEMEQYDFVTNLLKEITGAGEPITKLENTGINFQTPFTFFYGQSHGGDYTGASFHLKDSKAFYRAQNRIQLDEIALERDGKYVNDEVIWLKNKDEVRVMMLEPNAYAINQKADSISFARGWEIPYDYWEESVEAPIEDWDYEEEAEFYGEEIEPVQDEETYAYEEEQNETRMWHERYASLKDSLRNDMQKKMQLQFLQKDAFQSLKNNKEYSEFSKALEEPHDMTLFVNLNTLDNDYSYYKNTYDEFLETLMDQGKQIYQLDFTKEGIQIGMKSVMSEKRMEVFTAASNQKVNKELLSYIPAKNHGFMVSGLNSSEAYNKVKELFLPTLEESKEGEKLLIAAVWKMMDALVDESALFGMIPSNTVFSFNGMHEMEVEKVSFDYDEDTFEYTEVVTTEIQTLPSFTVAVHAPRGDLIENFFLALDALEGEAVKKEGNYYRLKDGPVRGIPFYVAFVNEIVIFTNEEDVVRNHLNGYGNKSLANADLKKIANSPMMYGKMDWEQLPEELKPLMGSSSERKMLDVLSDKTGVFEMTTGEMTENSFSMNVSYAFHGKYKNGAHYFLELIKSLEESDDM